MALPVPLPAAPSFPLSSAALISWQRFALKGGIGRAVGSQDQEALRPEDLMFLEGDEITVLMYLGDEMYLGLCEDVVGCFFADSVTFTTKLKRPVLSSRLSSPTLPPPPQPQPSAHSSHSEHEVAPMKSMRMDAEKQRQELQVLADEMDLGGVDDTRARRRRTNVAGLGLGIENVGRVQGPEKALWGRAAASTPSAALPGAFIPFPHSPSVSSLATPSLATSPSSDLDGSGSSNGHDAVTPPVPAWSPSVAIRGQSPARQPLAFASPHSSDEPTDKFPIIENFPFPAPRSYTPTAANPLGTSPPQFSQRSPSPPTCTFPLSTVVAPPPQALRSQFSDASLATTASRYKVSDGPSVDDMPHLPSAFSSPSSHHPSFIRVPKTSDASWRSDTSDGSGPNTPGGEDHTLAFIFDSYRYSMASVSTSTGNRTGSVTPENGPQNTKHSDGETERDEQEVLEEFESPVRNRLAPSNVHPSPFRFGAASDLRVRMEAMNSRGFDGDKDEDLEIIAPPRSSTDSFDMANIPRLSTIFPRSSTVDSLASIRSSQSTLSSSPPTETIPVDEAKAELDAARRLFDQHFKAHSDPSVTPRSNNVAATPSASSALPDSPTRIRTPNSRRKSIKGLVIGAPVVGSATGVPAWRAASNSPVQVGDPRDVFGAASSPATPSSAASYISSPMSQIHSTASAPSVTVQGATPAPPRRRLDYSDPSRTYYDDPNAPQLRGGRRPKLTIPSADGEPAQYALHPPSASSSPNFTSGASASTPTSPAFTVNSNTSSPSTSSFADEWRTTARERERSNNSSLRETSHPPPSNKLRKPNLRVKTPQQQQAFSQSPVSTLNISSPTSVDMAPSHSITSLASLASRDVFSSPPPPPTPSQQPPSPRRLNHKSSKGLFSRKLSGRAEGTPQPNGAFPATKGISSKDFEDETVKLGRGVEFEMVKPLRDIMQPGGEDQGSEEDDRVEELKSPTTPLGRPSMAASSRSYDDSGSSESGHGVNDFRAAASAYSTHVNSAGRPLSMALDEQSIENHRAKELRWLKALSSMSPSAMRKSKKMRALVHAGIPASVRGRVWCSLAEIEDVRIEGYYSTLCKMDQRLPVFDEIEADLAKTLQNHPQFAPESAGREELCSVLKAFARYDQELGYSPAMGFVGGLILSQVGDGELAFWTLISLVKNWDMKQFFPAGREELRIATLAFGFVLESAEPKLAKRFLQLGIDPSMFLTRWLSSLFCDTLPWASVLRITDLILFDSSYRLRVALAILELSHLDDPALFPTRESILHWLHNLPPPSFAPALLLPTVHTIKLREDKVKRSYSKAEKTIRKAAKQ